MEAQETRRMGPPRPTTLPPGSSTTTHPDITNIKNFHDEAFLYIDQGLSCDELGQGEQAVTLYQKGLRCIDRALEIPSNRPECRGPQWEKVQRMKEKMEKTKSQITSRVQNILQSDANAVRSLTDPPPSYEMATTPQSQEEDRSQFDSYFDSVDGGMAQAQAGEMMGNAVEIFSISEGVQIYFISSDGFVSAPSYPSSLGIYRFRDPASEEASNGQTPPAFLSIGSWTYPLVPGRSPALQAQTGTYLFPDVNSPDAGASVGVIIPEALPNTERARLQGLLNCFTDLRTVTRAEPETATETEALEEFTEEERREAAEHAEERRASTQISKTIVTAAEWISWGLEKGAEKTGEWLKKGSNKLREQITPESEPRQVDPRTQQGMKYARKATDSAVKVSAYIVDGLGKATLALGRQVAPHIRKQGEKYLPKSMTAPSEGQSKLDAVVEVAAGGLVGFGTVWMGLEKAGKALCRSVASETVSVVKHKYGHQVGDTTHDALYTVGNAALTAHNARNLGIKAIAKRTAKDTGKAVLEDYKKVKQMKDPSPQKDLLPPMSGPSGSGASGSGGSAAPPRPPPPAGGNNPMLQ